MTEVRFRDFSRKPREVYFSADGERYDCVQAVAPEVLQEMVVSLRTVKENPVDALKQVFELVLVEESAQRIIARLKRGHPNPLDIMQAVDICQWLTEEYAQRPTLPSTSSTDGSATVIDGTISTDGQPTEASTPSA
jgi:hypothetical protein